MRRRFFLRFRRPIRRLFGRGLKKQRRSRRVFFEALEARHLLTNNSVWTSVNPVNENGGSSWVGINRGNAGGPYSDTVVIDYVIEGTATPGQDHDLQAGSVTLYPGGSSWPEENIDYVLIPFNVENDSDYEGDETIIVTITNVWSSDGTPYDEPYAYEGYIWDDEEPAVNVSTSGSPSEDGPTTGTFTFTREGPTVGPLTVLFQVSGTASTNDYRNRSRPGGVVSLN
jgi:hypothetical protein